METTLTDMPNKALGKILEKCDFPSIQSLRKVCRKLRRSINRVRPETFIKSIVVAVDPKEINCTLHFEDRNSIIQIKYQKHEEGCLVSSKFSSRKKKQKQKIITNYYDIESLFCKDLEIAMRTQKGVLEDFKIGFTCYEKPTTAKFCAFFQNAMVDSEVGVLKVKNVCFKVSKQDQIKSLLTFTDPKTLEKIWISKIQDGKVLGLDEIVKLDQWKQVDHVEIQGLCSANPIDFKHFSKGFTYFDRISLEDILMFKQAFLQNPNFQCFKCNCEYIVPPEDHLVGLFGKLFFDLDELDMPRHRWFFRFPDDQGNQVLSIRFSRFYIEFERIDLVDVPQEAIVMN